MTLVVGATGAVGDTIVRRLLELGCGVRILVRPGSDYLSLVQAGAQPVLGDLRDRLSLQMAVRRVNTVIVATPLSGQEAELAARAGDLQGNGELIDQAARARVCRFIYTTAPGALSPSARPAWKAQVEQRLLDSGMAYAFIDLGLAAPAVSAAGPGVDLTSLEEYLFPSICA